MELLYFDCPTGLAGDMTLASLIDAGRQLDRPVEEAVQTAIASLPLDGVTLRVDSVMRGDFQALHVVVDHPRQHTHRHLSDIREILTAGDLTPGARGLADELFSCVAAGEAAVHGSTPEEVHFHEVGAVDSIVDIVGTGVAVDCLGVERIVCGPVPTGFGFVEIAHGVCPVPAPGTAEILRGVPLRDVPVEMELTTPTGAAVARVLADSFGRLPEMTVRAVGHGAGSRDIPGRANILRAFVGDAATAVDRDHVVLLETNLDDVSGEVIGHASQLLREAGALDVYSTPIQMKKHRPGVLLAVMARPADAEGLEELLFRETGTLGVRRVTVERSVRSREESEVDTPFGRVRVKISRRAGRSPQVTAEFDSASKVAARAGVTLREVYRAAESQTDFLSVTPASGAASGHHSSNHDHAHDHAHEHDHSHDH